MRQKSLGKATFHCQRFFVATSAMSPISGEANAKPYFKALANFPKHKEEIDVLPKKYHAVLARYVYSKDSYPVDEEDFFGNLVLYCIEADRATSGKNFYGRVFQIFRSRTFQAAARGEKAL